MREVTRLWGSSSESPRARRRAPAGTADTWSAGLVTRTTTRSNTLVLPLLFLFACAPEDAFEASTGETPAQFVERQCKEQMLDCELVYAFAQPAENPLGRVELCVRADDRTTAEGLYGASEISPDPRFDQWKLLGVQPVCWWQCPSTRGCNAYGGAPGQGSCFCPTVPMLTSPAPFDVNDDMRMLEEMLFPRTR